MGTPCVIAMRNGEDLYRWIFSPYDGNIQSVGRMLLDHYDTREKVERLLDGGWTIGVLPYLPKPSTLVILAVST